MIRVLHIETGSSLYGGGLQVTYLLARLPGYGIQNYFIGDIRSDLHLRVAESGSSVFPFHVSGEGDIRLLWHIMRVAIRERIDVIHVHSRRGGDLWGPLAGVLTRIPVIITRRVDNVEGFVLAGVRYGMADYVIGISRKITEVLSGEGIGGSRIETIHSAVDLEEWDVEKGGSGSGKGLPECPEGTVRIGMVAQFIKRKGHDRLLEVASRFQKMGLPVQFLLFGKGPLESHITEQVQKRGLEDSVVLCGFRKDLAEILPQLDILYHPADKEGLGVSLLQASACGLPIVGGNAGGIPEIIEHGGTGYLVEPDDLEAHELYLQKLVKNPELREKMGRRGRGRVEENFSADTMAARNADVYRKVKGFATKTTKRL